MYQPITEQTNFEELLDSFPKKIKDALIILICHSCSISDQRTVKNWANGSTRPSDLAIREIETIFAAEPGMITFLKA